MNMDEACRHLDHAVAALDLTDKELRFVEWMKRWDVETVEAVTAIIQKAKQS